MEIESGNYLMKSVVIVDYGMGNLHSISSALRKLGYSAKITYKEDELLNASHIILPGVGEFRKAMHNLRTNSLDQLIIKISNNSKVNILGICLGMQLLCLSSEEGGIRTSGLGLIDTNVQILESDRNYKLPHIGFNEVNLPANSIFKNKENLIKDFYFVHSYCLKNVINDKESKIGYAEYKNKFVAYYQKSNLYASQFHPEKSQTNGLSFLKSFLEV